MINIYILQSPFWVSLMFYIFHWNAQVSVKVSMISVLGKIKDVLGVIFVQKMCESWLKNNILFLIISYFNLKLINMYIFSHSLSYFDLSETEG